MADERDEAGGGGTTGGGGAPERGASGTDITGGTDKVGRGALANPDAPHTNIQDMSSAPAVPKTNDPPAEETAETGDIMGASSTHAGAGGVMDNTGGTGTAPTGDTVFRDSESS